MTIENKPTSARDILNMSDEELWPRGEQSTAAAPSDEYGGGGMSPDAIKLDDAYYTIKRLLQADLVTDREVREFTEAVERLIRR